MNVVWCCRMTGRMNFIRCVKTAWITVSVRHQLLMLKPTSSSTNWATRKTNASAPIGPLHVTSDGLVLHFRLFVDGENIIDADYRLFYVHRGMEKLAETRMGYNEVTFLSDRVCGICGFAHSTAYTTSVENAMGIQVPERAQMIRAILLEVERLHSHLLNLGLRPPLYRL